MSITLSSAEVSAMRDEADNYLPDTCTIERATQSQDAQGGIVNTFTTLASNVACRMDEPEVGSDEAAINGEVATAVKLIMHMGYSQDVTVKDRIVYSSKTYEVQEVLETATWLITRRLVLTRLD